MAEVIRSHFSPDPYVTFKLKNFYFVDNINNLKNEQKKLKNNKKKF